MRKRLFFLLGVLAMLLEVQPLLAQTMSAAQREKAIAVYREGKKFEDEKKMTEAAKCYLQAAEMGLDSAQNAIGWCYKNEKGVMRDDQKAVYWYQKAADQHHALAQSRLGFCYEWGNGVEKDSHKAFEWYQKSAAQDCKQGLVRLGICYYDGNGVAQDLEKAKRLFERALEKDKNQKGAKTYLQRVNKKLEAQRESTKQSMSVDKDIPVAPQYDMNTFAVIIGNEQYTEDDAVPYAENDAKIFKEYVQRTLGVPENQINYVTNAGLNKIRMAVRWLTKAMEVSGGKGKAVFYYAGHGIADEVSKTAYLLPVDGYSSDVESAYSLERLYQVLGSIPSQQILVFLDACFNGAKREGDMLASARGVAIKTKSQKPQGNMLVFAAAQNDETAYAYQEQQHGMFTYFLLKKMQETKGDTTLGELSDYLTMEVKRQAFEVNNKKQTPTVIPSQALADGWQQMRLR